jgi:hypothetical protein
VHHAPGGVLELPIPHHDQVQPISYFVGSIRCSYGVPGHMT